MLCKSKMSKWESNEEIKIFREYLRIPSVQPDIDYEPCVQFIKKQAMSLGLPVTVYESGHPEKPVVVITWIGTEPDLPSIALNSHMDVVPVFEEFWTHPPFAAEIDEEGKIFARGSQDMKNVGMQYLAAIRALRKENVKLKRTLHITFVPDEEISNAYGMKQFVKTPEFKALNIGFVFDEGAAAITDNYRVFFAEKSKWEIHFKCSGTTGHGSILHKNTAGEKIRYIIDKFMDFRAGEVQKLLDNPRLMPGNVTSLNLTMINGGVQINVVPPLITVSFDVRIAVDVDHTDFEKMLNRWCEEAGGGIEIAYEKKTPKVEATKIDDSNLFWLAFENTMVNELNLKIQPMVLSAQTDSTYIREIGIPAIGFSPMKFTPILAHAHNEYLKADDYLEGIDIYKQILLNVANV